MVWASRTGVGKVRHLKQAPLLPWTIRRCHVVHYDPDKALACQLRQSRGPLFRLRHRV